VAAGQQDMGERVERGWAEIEGKRSAVAVSRDRLRLRSDGSRNAGQAIIPSPPPPRILDDFARKGETCSG
jgi:hypothetical protein